MNTIEKYCFSTDNDLSCINIGISEERHDEMTGIAKKVVLNAMILDDTIEHKSQGYEMYLNKVKPANMVEAVWCGVIYQDIWKQVETASMLFDCATQKK